MDALRLERIEKSFSAAQGRVPVLRGIDLSVSQGECICVVGPSGSGKTTLLSVCGLISQPDSGRRWLAGEDVTDLDIDESADLRFTSIGFCFQNSSLAPTLTALENVTLPAVPRGVTAEMRERASGILNQLGLGERLNHLPSQISGGEQQRVAIARSLLMDPMVLLVDEPTANLDRATARSIATVLRSVVEDPRRTVVIATHDPIIIEIGDRVLQLEDGHLSALAVTA